MSWKNRSYWVRGLSLGVLTGLIIFAFHYIKYLKCQENPIAYGDALRCLGPEIGLGISIWVGLGLSLFGLIVGLIYGKIKQKR